ncbi:MAG: translation initiation factor IF-3 [Candidatus Moranbacteria bacterium RIFCSPHIGHO2_02_FULL_40_12b]|nr:MAG: translation initiation factor IF-3 [Candidatus Moranbacteria bacterium RIFCSPHIGHO2_02_FULL_40_12b]
MQRGPQTRANEYIRALEVVVIDENGNNLGVMKKFDAIDLAKSRELDLVEVSPKANPPVCRMMDYGKFQYKKAREAKQSKARQKKVEVKEIRVGIRTDEHDLAFKKDQAEKFLKKGNKVKVDIILKGREKAHQGLARETLKNFNEKIEVPHKIEEDIKRSPRGFNIIIAPYSN